MPFGIGAPELAIILVIVVIIFGVGKLPEIGGALGKGIREFKTESGVDENGKPIEDKKLDKGTSKTASTLTASTTDDVKEPVAAGKREVRADEI
ncbi:MAG: twin-arginine translocase TatA/TatE family subunit [Thermomicrobiales bacterium]